MCTGCLYEVDDAVVVADDEDDEGVVAGGKEGEVSSVLACRVPDCWAASLAVSVENYRGKVGMKWPNRMDSPKVRTMLRSMNFAYMRTMWSRNACMGSWGVGSLLVG